MEARALGKPILHSFPAEVLFKHPNCRKRELAGTPGSASTPPHRVQSWMGQRCSRRRTD